MKRKPNYFLITIIFALMSLLVFNIFISGNTFSVTTIDEFKKSTEEIKYSEFLTTAKDNKVTAIYYDKDLPIFYIEKENKFFNVINPEYETFKKDMLEQSIDVKSIADFNDKIIEINRQKISFGVITHYAIFIICLFLTVLSFVLYIKNKRKRQKKNHDKVEVLINAMGGIPNMVEKKKEQPPIHKTQTFDDVAGLREVKKDVKCLVDFLKNKDKYIAAGAKLPKGVIFYGPPGTGKTLLAKAIAGEAGIPFHYMSGSDFVEMYVGVGAKRVRELFAEAKKKTPCIVFIDEIDAIGGKRSREDSNGEDKKTLNALLTEMDGFHSDENIIVIGATNQIEALDSALLRPGRFTNKYCVPLPCSASERLEVIKLYIKNKKFTDDVDFSAIAKETMGFSPAAIESLLNEAAIISVQDNKDRIDKESIDKAMIKTLLSGHLREDQEDRNKEELKLVAWHEAGHALVGKLNGKEIPKVTILSSTSGAGGVTFTTPKEETGLYTVEDLKNEVKELYAGRIAELLMNGDASKVTTGASNDIERATNVIKSIITSYGMSEEFGLLNLNQLNVKQDIIIDKEIKLAKEIEKDTIELMKNNFASLEKIANALIEHETLYDSDLTKLMSDNVEVETIVVDEEEQKDEEVTE